MEDFDWKEYDIRLPEFEDLVISIFRTFCTENGNSVTEISRNSIPKYFPRLVKDFYQKCAPLKLTVGDIEFFSYTQVFELANQTGGKYIPIAHKGEILRGGKNLIYMDKNINGVDYDPRVQLCLGNQKVMILGTNIFTFISNISQNNIKTYP